MYLHIGRDWMIPYGAIIGFFPYDILELSPELRHLFHTRRLQGLVLGDWQDPKTLILTDREVYLSAISPLTLLRRSERRGFQFE